MLMPTIPGLPCRAASRAAAAGAPLVTPNVDPRLPLADGDFLPGCGAIVAAVAAAAGVTPVVVGKPEPPLFRMALRRLGLAPHEAAMVGDSTASDVAGGRAAGMRTVFAAHESGSGSRAMSDHHSHALTAPVVPTFFSYAALSMVGLLAITTMNVVDGAFVGNYVGGDALAAIALLIPYFTVVVAVTLMLAIGGSVTAGVYFAGGDEVRASSIFGVGSRTS